jgi:hypothetical protein
VADAVRLTNRADSREYVIVDSIRTMQQALELRAIDRVVHVHVTARREILASRYRQRYADNARLELPSYDSVLANATEAAVPELARLADVVIDTSSGTVKAATDKVLRTVEATC